MTERRKVVLELWGTPWTIDYDFTKGHNGFPNSPTEEDEIVIEAASIATFDMMPFLSEFPEVETAIINKLAALAYY